MSRKQFDFQNVEATEIPYQELGHDFDVRLDGGQDIDFVVQELIPSYKDAGDALAETLKHPIQVTKDFQLVVGRANALALKIILGEDNPKIPVEILKGVPAYGDLDEEDKLRLRIYAMKADMLKTKQRGLKQRDLQFNITEFVKAGYTLEEVIEKLRGLPDMKEWKVKKLYYSAKNAWRQKQYASGREEVAALKKAGKVPNVSRIMDRLGIPDSERTSFIQNVINGRRNGARTLAINALKNKQSGVYSKIRDYVDRNFEHHSLSASGQLATSDFENKTPMSGQTFIAITEHHLKKAQELVTYLEGAVQRAHAQVNKRDGLVARLRQNAGME